MLASLLRPASRGVLVFAALLAVSCAPTRVHLSTSAPQVKQVFAVAAGFGTLSPVFEKGDSRTLGDFAQRLPSGAYDFASFRLADSGDATNVWKTSTEPTTGWMGYSISQGGDEVKVTIDKSGFSKRPDLCLGVVVLTDSANTGQRYYGTMIDTASIEPTGFWIFKSGPSMRVALQGDGPPTRTSRD